MRVFLWYLLMFLNFGVTIFLGYKGKPISFTLPVILISTILCYQPLRNSRQDNDKEMSPISDLLFLLVQQSLVIIFFYMTAGVLLAPIIIALTSMI